MKSKYIAKVLGEYITNESPGLMSLTADITKAGRFECFAAARDACETEFRGEAYEIIEVQPALPE